MMIGFDVAPVAPSARLAATRSGSTESSQSLVPQATSDSRGVMVRSLHRVQKGEWAVTAIVRPHFLMARPGGAAVS